ncbi:MAG: hypothetical protein AAGH76_02910 [Pseudomonadota bacterium]
MQSLPQPTSGLVGFGKRMPSAATTEPARHPSRSGWVVAEQSIGLIDTATSRLDSCRIDPC